MSGRDELAGAALSTPAPLLMGVERIGADGAINGSAADGGEEPARKRAKLEETGAVRRRILEAELGRLRALRDRFTDQLSELYFLQAGGNMMDYAVWRKRPPAPQLLAFLEARRPPPVPPAPAPAPAPAHPDPTPTAPAIAVAPVPPAADEMVEKAKQEAYVAGRVAELARAGLWAERRLPRVMEPPRAKTHWDYLLEEMAWLAQDFAHERKWKKQAAKKCARAVQKYFQDKAMAAQKAEKAQEMQLKKIAAFAAKEIRTFWANVEKLVEWKRVRRVERARKQALDEQLSYIVDRTERYSRQLAAGLGADTPPDEDEAAAHDYRPAGTDSDDETTIAEQERAEPAPDPERELAMLRADADLDLDELRRRYAEPAPTPPTPTTASSEADTETDTDAGTGTETDAEDTGTGSDSEALEALVRSRADAASSAGVGGGEERVEAAASLAATLQPTGTTLSSTTVGTRVPALLRHALREYQHVGLHWLATMYARGLNGILADEMGLGKTVQTIALLAHLATEHGDWGPHLVIAPTSVVLNWEMEFKKWCPAFKILTYYGTIRERKAKRVGWTKANSFHVCITSYKLVVQDHQSFRRKRWKYLVLDEAQNIKNFKSQRWRLLLNFTTERRLLLTGTPLQNSLAELWSLMHFLMPEVFASAGEFRAWFGDVGRMAEGARRVDEALVRRLHAVLRPFLLRRLKRDVERQMPRKYEHVLLCRLARRQRFLYDDFMARAGTRDALASGNLLSVINVLMQLRKVCNHPDLFEPRPVASPLQLEPLRLLVPALAFATGVAERSELAARLGGALADLEAGGAGAFAAHRARHLAPPRRLVEEVGESEARARPPPASLRLHLRLVPRAPPPARAPPPPAPPARAAPPRPPPAGPGAAPGARGRLEARRRTCLRRLASCNERRCWRLPLYGADLLAAAAVPPAPHLPRPTLQDMLRDNIHLVEKFTVCWRSCVAPRAEAVVGRGAGAWAARVGRAEGEAPSRACAAMLRVLHAAASRAAVAFPHPSLLQYDCGKLQALASLLRRLKARSHRVLIFTQMTRVLDVLESFLSRQGHAYLRLDGSTRVDRRQPLVDRFNADGRVFAFILSTRSGGVGLNLTGADAVVFYDSDWNPTMDAQAQDRCHRIGQTRDVHVYRLVTAATVEENILRKAHQKRRLGRLAIDEGHFTTSTLRGASIEELFGSGGDGGGTSRAGAGGAGDGGGDEGELERALAAAEDEADAAAALAAGRETRADLAEFDETLPLREDEDEDLHPPHHPHQTHQPHRRVPDADLATLMAQLTPIEKYAMRVVESSEAARGAEQSALGEVRRQLGEWERARARLRCVPADTPPPVPVVPAPAEVTAPRSSQVWVCSAGGDMPLWAPPTPPAADSDVYVERWARALYRGGAAPEHALPPAARRDPRARGLARRHAPCAPPAPLSLFERGGRRAPRPPRLHAHLAAPPHPPPAPDFTAAEDAALRRALRLQHLPPEPPPALAPNWDWVAELVAEPARAYRSPRACRDRHEALADPERARRRHRRPPAPRRRADDAGRPPLHRLEAVREAGERRRGAASRRRPDDAPPRNPKHAALLAEHGVEYDAPPSPMEVAARRAERIAREKLKASATPAGAGAGATSAAAPGPSAPAAPRVLVAAGRAPTPQLLYRQQTFPARHLKILHQAANQSGGVAGEAGAALRKLQLQQLALRRAGVAGPAVSAASAGPGPGPGPGHVLVAHLTPAPAPRPAPAQPPPAADPRP